MYNRSSLNTDPVKKEESPTPDMETRIQLRRERIRDKRMPKLDALYRPTVIPDPRDKSESLRLNAYYQQIESFRRINENLLKSTNICQRTKKAMVCREMHRQLMVEKEMEILDVMLEKDKEKSKTFDFRDIDQEKMQELIDEKDVLINHLISIHERRYKEFLCTLKYNMRDISVVMKRIKEMKHDSRDKVFKEVELYSTIIDSELTQLIDQYKKSFYEQIGSRMLKESAIEANRIKIAGQADNEEGLLLERESEVYSELRSNYFSQIDNLTNNLQQMKAVYTINQEQIEYNFQIARQKTVENNLIISNQRRRIAHFEQKLKIIQNLNQKENQDLTKEMQVSRRKYLVATDLLQRLAYRLTNLSFGNRKNYLDLFQLKTEECEVLFRQIIHLVTYISEHELKTTTQEASTTYSTVETVSTKSSHPTTMLLTRSKSQSKYMMKNQKFIFQDSSVKIGNKMEEPVPVHLFVDCMDNEELSKLLTKAEYARKYLNNSDSSVYFYILNHVENSMAFVVDQHCRLITNQYLKHERKLLRLHSIFKMFNIDTKQKLKIFCSFLISNDDIPRDITSYTTLNKRPSNRPTTGPGRLSPIYALTKLATSEISLYNADEKASKILKYSVDESLRKYRSLNNLHDASQVHSIENRNSLFKSATTQSYNNNYSNQLLMNVKDEKWRLNTPHEIAVGVTAFLRYMDCTARFQKKKISDVNRKIDGPAKAIEHYTKFPQLFYGKINDELDRAYFDTFLLNGLLEKYNLIWANLRADLRKFIESARKRQILIEEMASLRKDISDMKLIFRNMNPNSEECDNENNLDEERLNVIGLPKYYNVYKMNQTSQNKLKKVSKTKDIIKLLPKYPINEGLKVKQDLAKKRLNEHKRKCEE
ncbi:hypothetical protein SNEBB_007903 [Seison nebaliae]|nr:hypothetical protein SNEBB_007903 [Seison nebaliae]